MQTYWLDGCRSAPVAGNARGRDLDVAAASKHPAAGCSKKTLLPYHRPIDIRWALSVVTHLYIFEIAGQLRFVQILVKARDEYLRYSGAHYKAVCAKLDLDPVVPLVLVYGLFRPRDVTRFIQNGPWIRRKWANNTVLLELPEEVILADPNSYDWHQPVRIQSTVGTDSQYCEDAKPRPSLLLPCVYRKPYPAMTLDLVDKTLCSCARIPT